MSATAELEKDDTKMKEDTHESRTRADAGRLGGIRTKQKYGGTGFYSKIGRNGGKARGKTKVL